MNRGQRSLKHPDVPDWFKHLAPNSMLGYRGINKLFGFAESYLPSAMARGHFPKADSCRSSASGRYMINQWYVKTIRAEIKRRLDLYNKWREE